MTPTEKSQLKKALLKYYFENRPRWYHYEVQIKQKLGIDDNDKCLHERDPRNWIIDGMEPNREKLAIYERFIRAVYPDFEFQDALIAEQVELGMALARFTNTEKQILDKDSCHYAAQYDGKLYIEELFWDDIRPEKNLFSLVQLRHILGTPFLAVLHFDMYGLSLHNEDTNAFMDVRYSTDFNKDMTLTEDTAKMIESRYEGLIESGAIYPKNAVKGILSPSNDRKSFHGILQPDKSVPYHLIVSPHRDGDFSVKRLGAETSSNFTLWRLCREMKKVEEMVFKFENNIQISNPSNIHHE